MKIKIIINLYFIFMISISSAVAEWRTSWIDWGEPYTGLYPVIKITSEGVVHICYLNYTYDEAGGQKYTYLRYLVLEKGNITADWTPDVMAGFDSAGNAGNYVSMAIDTQGHPHISYCDGASGTLKYAFFDGSAWHRETIETEAAAGLYLSLALDNENSPHISYYEGSGKGLRYLHYDGDAWEELVVDQAEEAGAYNSLALDRDGLPRIAYYDEKNGTLKFAAFDGGTWETGAVDLPGDAGLYASLALDQGGLPHVACYNRSLKALQYASLSSSGGWQVQFVVSGFRDLVSLLRAADDEGSYCSLAIDSDGRPHISYFNAVSLRIQYASPDDSGRWWVKELPASDAAGPYNCLAIDASDKPHIACFYSAEQTENN